MEKQWKTCCFDVWPLWSRSTEKKTWKKRGKPFIRCNCRDCGRCIWVSVRHPAAPKYPAPSIPVFLSTSLGFWDMGQHGTNGKLPENKSWSLCQHPLALGRAGLKKNVVSLGRWWWEDVGRLRHYKMETPNPRKSYQEGHVISIKSEHPTPQKTIHFWML